MAKPSKKSERSERRAVVEQMRRDQARREHRRTLSILAVSLVVVGGLLAAALVPYLKDRQREQAVAAVDLSDLGVEESAASCEKPKIEEATGSGQHEAAGTPISYDAAPPAYGSHWGNFLQGVEIRPFYNTEDRPEVERLVHSLEHGHTILWYDDTVKPGTESYRQVQEIAGKFETGDYFMAAPWQASDGGAFPEGNHVALTHWTGPTKQQGITQYCAKPSGSVVESFMDDYDKFNAPEPGAP